jgi:DtxR family Mn-dependent transcriptional regulator
LKKTGLSESLEDYLEIILALEKSNKVARVKDIAVEMGVLRGSVTVALKSLGEKGLIHYKPYSFITLTRKGATVAKKIARRHSIIKDFLVNVLQIDDEAAETNACRMEHAMDQAAVERLVRFIEHIHLCPRTDNDWKQSFVEYYANEKHDRQKCKKCLDKLPYNWAVNAKEPLK